MFRSFSLRFFKNPFCKKCYAISNFHNKNHTFCPVKKHLGLILMQNCKKRKRKCILFYALPQLSFSNRHFFMYTIFTIAFSLLIVFQKSLSEHFPYIRYNHKCIRVDLRYNVFQLHDLFLGYDTVQHAFVRPRIHALRIQSG